MKIISKNLLKFAGFCQIKWKIMILEKNAVDKSYLLFNFTQRWSLTKFLKNENSLRYLVEKICGQRRQKKFIGP